MTTKIRSNNTSASSGSSTEISTSKWWEFYTVRYAVGTVIGAILFYTMCTKTPILKPLLLDINFKDFNAQNSLLLIAYGLTFCYIASAPILVFHAGRFLLVLRNSEAKWLGLLRLVFIPLFPTIIVYCKLKNLNSANGLTFFFGLTAYVAFFLLFNQLRTIFKILLDSSAMYAFYRALTEKRSKAKGGIVDSYKHMREHGNSFLIVTLEIVLTVLLYSLGKICEASGITEDQTIAYFTLFTFLWILPASLVWVVGNCLEREFSEIEK
ncbi:hypothetical protein [Undibacterium sp. Ji22W]|uniref:hypothetical protein n=1 Tax=Undibacterium sp. Ji22W TaxID=3413038 RepID=UPI003BEFD06C